VSTIKPHTNEQQVVINPQIKTHNNEQKVVINPQIQNQENNNINPNIFEHLSDTESDSEDEMEFEPMIDKVEQTWLALDEEDKQRHATFFDNEAKILKELKNNDGQQIFVDSFSVTSLAATDTYELKNPICGEMSVEDTSSDAYSEVEACYVCKMDTGCGHCMSGIRNRIKNMQSENNVRVKGVGGMTYAEGKGVNTDNKHELFVSSLGNLALLCAVEYAKDGCIVLFGNDGVVLSLSDHETQQMRKYIQQYKPDKKLIVNNNTYEVLLNEDEKCKIEDMVTQTHDHIEKACYAANTYFNTKINVTTKTQRIVAYMLAGLSWDMLYCACKDKSITGLHPEITVKALNKFGRKYGKTPDIIQLAHQNKLQSIPGLDTKPFSPKRVGSLVESDNLTPDQNDYSTQASTSGKKVSKIKTHGGGIGANITIDTFSHFVHGTIFKSSGNMKQVVRNIILKYATKNHAIDKFAADVGISTQSMFQVFTPEVEQLLLEELIEIIKADPHNHQNGTPLVERMIESIKNKIRFAFTYVLKNPNIKKLGYTTEMILKLWGEVLHWAIFTENLRPSPSDSKKTRFEVFNGEAPNIQRERLLPIFSVVKVYRYVTTTLKEDWSTGPFFQYGLYVGHDQYCSGVIRVAVIIKDQVKVLRTSKYKGVSEGGDVDIYPIAEEGIKLLINDQTVTDVEEYEETNNEKLIPIKEKLKSKLTKINNEIPLQEKPSSSVIDKIEDKIPVPDDSTEQDIKEKSEISEVKMSTKKRLLTLIWMVMWANIAMYEGNQRQAEINTAAKKKKKIYTAKNHPDRAERAARRRTDYIEKLVDEEIFESHQADLVSLTDDELIEAYYVDWSKILPDSIYFDFAQNTFCRIATSEENLSVEDKDAKVEVEGYRAVTKNVPKSFQAALTSSEWGDAARHELNVFAEQGTMVELNKEVAQTCIENGADIVIIFPVYEEKIKEGKLVRKVRLVCNGKTQYHAGATYSPTPSREEFYVLLHLIATLNWEFAHIDESRAFLTAKYKGETPVLAKFQGDKNKYWNILGALYGLKTSPRDYGTEVIKRLNTFGFHKLHHCSSIHKKITENNHVIFAYVFVDDFIMTGSSKEETQRAIDQYRTVATTTEPSWDPENTLGHNLHRDRETNTISVDLSHKIEEIAEFLNLTNEKSRHTPMPILGYIVNPDDIAELVSDDAAENLTKSGISLYMKIVGTLIWLLGVRLDIVFSVLYLSWHTKNPKRHHLNMAKKVVIYLFTTKSVPLILGGKGDIEIMVSTDSSYGTGPKGRSISGHLVRLHPKAGAVSAKSHASRYVRLSTFESELEGLTTAVKTLKRLINVITELYNANIKVTLESDNLAMINFVKGEGVAKGVRHMELRMYYTREQYSQGFYELIHTKGTELAADKLTKLGSRKDHRIFMENIQGLRLLPKYEAYKVKSPHED